MTIAGSIPWHYGEVWLYLLWLYYGYTYYDEVRAHGEARLVATLSFGAPRRFGLRRRRVHSGGEAGGKAGLQV